MPLLDTLILCLTIAIACLLMLRIFNRAARLRTPAFLNIANFSLFVLLAFNFIVACYGIIDLHKQYAAVADPDMEQYLKRDIRSRYLQLSFVFLTGLLLQFFFLWKRNRVNFWMTVVSVLLVWAMMRYQHILDFVLSLGRDYIPSSWAVYRPWPPVWFHILFAVICFGTCWILAGYQLAAAKKNKKQ